MATAAATRNLDGFRSRFLLRRDCIFIITIIIIIIIFVVIVLIIIIISHRGIIIIISHRGAPPSRWRRRRAAGGAPPAPGAAPPAPEKSSLFNCKCKHYFKIIELLAELLNLPAQRLQRRKIEAYLS